MGPGCQHPAEGQSAVSILPRVRMPCPRARPVPPPTARPLVASTAPARRSRAGLWCRARATRGPAGCQATHRNRAARMKCGAKLDADAGRHVREQVVARHAVAAAEELGSAGRHVQHLVFAVDEHARRRDVEERHLVLQCRRIGGFPGDRAGAICCRVGAGESGSEVTVSPDRFHQARAQSAPSIVDGDRSVVAALIASAAFHLNRRRVLRRTEVRCARSPVVRRVPGAGHAAGRKRPSARQVVEHGADRNQLSPRHDQIHVVEKLALARSLGRQVQTQISLLHGSYRRSSDAVAKAQIGPSYAERP